MTGLTIVQARLGSTRFPRKILADLAGKPVLTHVVERAMQIGPWTVVACPAKDRAEISPVIPRGATLFGIHGRDENDVLGRFCDVVKAFWPVDYIVRVTGDSPCLDSEVGRDIVKIFESGRSEGVDPATWQAWRARYVANCYPPPDCADGGLDVEVVDAQALLRADVETDDPQDREHPTRFLWRRPFWFACDQAPIPPGYGTLGIRWMVDTPEDLDRLRTLVGAGYDGRWDTLYAREQAARQEV